LNTEKLHSYATRLEGFFGPEIAQRVMAALNAAPTVSLRVNREKPTDQFDHLPRVPWAENAYILPERPVFALDPLFHAGCYYVQDSSSMILEAVLKELVFEEDNIAMLDACAAPGGKSLIALDTLGHRGFLVANETDPKRNSILAENLLKWGKANHAICRADSNLFGDRGELFDLIIVDAPCSGEGMFRKDAFAVEQWSETLVTQCALTQERILDNLRPSLKGGGYLVYATCTLNPEENQVQIHKLLESGFEMALPALDAFRDFLVPGDYKGKTLGYYLLPGISTGEGLFISAVRKTGSSSLPVQRKPNRSLQLARFQQSDIHPLTTGVTYDLSWTLGNEVYGVNDEADRLHTLLGLPFKRVGLPVYERKGKINIPLHGLAMDPRMKCGNYELDLQEALNYLRKQSTSAPGNNKQSWMTACYKRHPLGWVKAVPGRVNNYYPANFRLRI